MIKTSFHYGNIFKEIKESIDLHERNIRAKLNAIAPATKKKMHEVIQSNKKRPQAGEPTKLEDNIDAEIFPAEAGWGVGEIARLNKNAKYWRSVNYGSSHMVGKQLPPGVFDPGAPAPDQGSFRAGRFKKGMSKDDKSYAPIVTKEIPAMNYIQKTVNFVRREINRLKFGK